MMFCTGEPIGEICQRGDAHKLTAPELKEFLMGLGVKGSSKLKKQVRVILCEYDNE